MNDPTDRDLSPTPRPADSNLAGVPHIQARAAPTLATADAQDFVALSVEELASSHIPFLLAPK